MAKKTIPELREFVNKNMPSNSELLVKPFRTFFSYIIDHLEDIPGTLNINAFMYKVFGTSNIDDVDFQEYFGEEFTGNNLVSYLQWLVETGITGPEGDSAYEVAVKNGFIGTEAEWLLSLKGDKGDPGEKGDQGDPGLPCLVIKVADYDEALTESTANPNNIYYW